MVALITQFADSWRFILYSIPIVEATTANRMVMITFMSPRPTIVTGSMLSCRRHLRRSAGPCGHKGPRVQDMPLCSVYTKYDACESSLAARSEMNTSADLRAVVTALSGDSAIADRICKAVNVAG